MTIGVLIPYSGEFPELKQAIVEPLKRFAAQHNYALLQEYIGCGDFKTVEKALHKLCYQDDVDVIVGYVGYRVMVRLFDTMKKYRQKSFIHLSLGEIIPYSNRQLTPPANYKLISLEAYQQQSQLGQWIAKNIAPENCLMCSSLYDSGYSLMDSFRIGFHAEKQLNLHFTILKNPPGVFDITPLYEEIERSKPSHLHIVLCGRELEAFLNQFSGNISYTPTLSFAFPLEIKAYAATHPSFEKTYTVIPSLLCDTLSQELPFKTIFNYLSKTCTNQLQQINQTSKEQLSLVIQNLNTGEIQRNDSVNTLIANVESAYEYSAAHMVSGWENPYLCI